MSPEVSENSSSIVINYRIPRVCRVVLYLPQSQPNRGGAYAGRKIGQRRFAMKGPGAAGGFQTETAHHFERRGPEGGAVCRKEDARIPRRDFQRREQQGLEIVLDLESFAAMRPGERRRIEYDDVELFALARESRQHRHHVI